MKKDFAYKIFDTVSKITLILLTVAALMLLFFLIQSKVNGRDPSINGYQMYMVMSGSMSPAVNTGSLVVVKPVDLEEIKPQDIITFRGEIERENITTHRVVEIHKEDKLFFRTRGDANEVEDPMPVSANQIIGKVILSIPYGGYVFHFARSQTGIITIFLLLIIFTFVELVKTLCAERKIDKAINQKKEVDTKEKG